MNKWMIWGFSHIFGNTHVSETVSKSVPKVNEKLLRMKSCLPSGEAVLVITFQPCVLSSPKKTTCEAMVC